MKDMLDKNVQLNDLVAYVYVNKNGKVSTNVGRVVAINSVRVKLLTQNGVQNVSNIIRLEQPKAENAVKKLSMFEKFRSLLKV